MIDVAYKIVAFLVTLGVLVIFHELGHFIVARWCGVKVLRFSVGFGRVVWARKRGPDQTEWALSAVPLGGYVKMVDEREGSVPPADLPRAFNRQSVWRRMAIVAAGPVANLLLAVLLFAGTYVAGVPGQRPLLAAPPPSSAAASAGLRGGDLIVDVDGEPVASWQELRWRLIKAQGQPTAVVTVERPEARGQRLTHTLPLTVVKPADWEGGALTILGLKADFGPPLIDQVLPDKPAERAGMKAGDRIVAIDGMAVRSPADVATITNAKPGGNLVFRIAREGAQFDAPLTADAVEQGGRQIGIAGVRLRVDPAVIEGLQVTVRYGPIDALLQGARKTAELSVFTVQMLGRILVGDASVKNISGPLTMADFAGQSAQQGILVFVGYLALISISLGVLNLLPVPLLDGGHLLYYFAEIIKGSPVSDRAFEVGQRIGMAMLAMLMALALFNDVSRLF
jgi:regulator of sigma E protease